MSSRLSSPLIVLVFVLAVPLSSWSERPTTQPAPQAQTNVSAETPEKARAASLETAAVGPIDAYVIAGGGGSSSGSSFALQGTIGQAAAGGPLTGASFNVSSGFWNAVDGGVATPPKRRRGQLTSQ